MDLTTEVICGRLASLGVDEATVGRIFAARPSPSAPKIESTGDEDADLAAQEHADAEFRRTFDFERKFVMGVPVPGRKAVLLVYRFGRGEPLLRDRSVKGPQETGPNWRPRWVSFEGPMPLDEVEAKARELTNG